MMEASQRMITINSQGEEGKDGGGMNPAKKRHLELEIKTLQNAPRDAEQLERLLKAKEREEKQTATHIEDRRSCILISLAERYKLEISSKSTLYDIVDVKMHTIKN